MAPKDKPADEVVWRSPEWVQHLGGVHENTVLFYFAKSPFFDPTSNNATVETQAMYNQEMLTILETRENFESHLEKLNGIEYRVLLGPKDFGPEAPIGQGIWVIRKQNRRIVYGQDNGGAIDAQITVLATYFVVGEIVYMARSITDIISARLLATTTALNKVAKKVSSLALFTPGAGYHYIPPHLKRKKKMLTASQSEFVSSGATPAADNASEVPATTIQNAADDSGGLDTLLDAWRQTKAYFGEYMDQNPIIGEPGSFHFSNSAQHVQVQKEAAARRVQQAEALKKAQEEARQSKLRAEKATPETPMVKKEAVPMKRAHGKDGKPKPKRRKTKNPGTPRTAASTPVATPR